jgi:selenocysteine-specific elongation factor
MPQTREHLQILDLLGLTRGAVALTKTDRVNREQTASVLSRLHILLRGTVLGNMPVFPVSAVTGEGVAALRAHLENAAASTPPRPCDGAFRLAVDRCFTLAGSGTVVTGTVFAGTVRVGDRVVLTPSGIAARVRGIHAQNRPAEEGRAGQRCALNLAGPQVEKSAIRRGDWVVEEGRDAPSPRLDVRLKLLASEEKPLRHWSPVHFHHGAADVTGRVALLEGDMLEPGATALAQIVLDRPVGAVRGDRFIVRDQSASRTLGGGEVLDPYAPARHRRAAQRLQLLDCLSRRDWKDSLEAMLNTSEGVDLGWFALTWNLRPDQPGWEGFPLRRVSAAEGVMGFSEDCWARLKQRTVAQLAEHHRLHGDEPGPDAGRLRRAVDAGLRRSVFAALLEELIGEGRLAQNGPWLHLPEHRVRLGPAEEELWARVRPLLAEGRFDPPWVRDIARRLQTEEGSVRRLLLRLARLGEVHQVTRDLFFSREAVAELAALARELEAGAGDIRAAAFRDRIGIGRKRAIQILEFFDRIGFTRRAGDAHRIRGDGLL